MSPITPPADNHAPAPSTTHNHSTPPSSANNATIENNTDQHPPHIIDKNNRYFDTDHLHTELKQHTVRGGIFTLAAQVIRQVIQLATTAVLARILTPDDFGVFAMIIVLTGFMEMFGDLGLSLVTIQRPKITQDQVSALFWINLAVGLLAALAVAALAPALVWFNHEPRLLLPTCVLGLSLLFTGLGCQHNALLRRQMQFKRIAFNTAIAAAIGSTVGIVTAIFDAGLWALVYMQLAISAANSILAWLQCSWRPSLPRRAPGLRDMLHFGGNMTAFQFIHYATSRLDVLLIGRYCGSALLGLYSKAYNLVLMPIGQINIPVSSVAIPALSRLNDDPARYRRAYLQILEKLALITGPGVALMIASSHWIINLILGPQWNQAAQMFAILGFAGLLIPIGNTIGWLFVSQNRTRQQLAWGIIHALLLIASVALGIQWGINGVVIAVALRMYIIMPLGLYYVSRQGPLRFQDFLIALRLPALITLTVLAAITAFYHAVPAWHPAAGLALAIPLTAAITIALLSLFPHGRRIIKQSTRDILAKGKKS